MTLTMHNEKQRLALYVDVLVVGIGALAYAALVRTLYHGGLEGAGLWGSLGAGGTFLLIVVLTTLGWFLTRAMQARVGDVHRRVW